MNASALFMKMNSSRGFLYSMEMRNISLFLCLFLLACGKDDDSSKTEPPVEELFISRLVMVNGVSDGLNYNNVSINPRIEVQFSLPVDKDAASASVKMNKSNTEAATAVRISFEKNDSAIIIQPANPLSEFSKYTISVSTSLKTKNGVSLALPLSVNLSTSIDSTYKFPVISDEELLTLVQRQTFRYFWEFGHPVSGMARERSTSGNTVTTGGTGFGIMAMIVAVEREFISRNDASERVRKIVTFLKDKCTSYHGVYSHWVNGETGQTQPFSSKDNGADLVETSYLFKGLLTARQYFSGNDVVETQLRSDINDLWEAVEWDWFRRDGQNVLYWHWSPDYEWDMNHQIRGWNECLITYIMAASSPTYPIPAIVYDEGWAKGGGIKNGNTYHGHKLPLGESFGGPLFFAHYSFLGINPHGLSDKYADYWEQNTNHSLINYRHCIENPSNYLLYSADCWGLTAGDGDKGYSAHSPTNDKGVISPTAALSSMPFTPGESTKALHFFYYLMGDKLWKEYGFVDAFNPTANWYDSQFLAIDQGPVVIMIENYRTGLLWNLFMSCPEIQEGLSKLGFNFTVE